MGVWKKVALAVALTGNIVLAESFKGDLLLYAPFDGHLDALTGQGGLLSGRFLRNSVAYTGDWKKFERNQPRYVTGRFGEGIFLESGDYGNYARGTRNNLPPDKATGVLPAGLASAGEARITRQSSSLAGLAGVRVNCRAAGAGIVTGEFSLPVAMRYIASVYLKGTSGGEKVRLVFSDKTNQVEEVASVVLTPAWARYYVVLACDEQSKKYGEKTLQEPFQAVFSILSEEPADFSAAAFMVEQTGMHYSNRLTPSSWVPPGSIRGSEVLTLPVAPETFNPEAGTISFWMFLEPGRFNRTFFSVGAGWDTFIMLNEYPSGRLCFTYWGGRNSVPLPQTGQWLHVALTWSGAAAAMYLNGKKTISVTGQKFEPESVWRR
ncbi:MAG TPA: hypothetical protein PK644_00630, partial [bacterium]|nr:hypothetical protein [bacterium]